MFDKTQFVEDVRDAMHEGDAQDAVSAVLEKAVSDPAAMLGSLGAPGKGRVEPLYKDEGLTILNVIWGSEMWAPPHDHTIWAAIGVYQGQEDNTFWREDDAGLTEQGGVALRVGDVRKLGPNAIHSVKNPSATQLCAAVHVYGGDFFDAIPRRFSWDPQSLQKGPYDYELLNALRDQANERMEALIRDGISVA